MRGINKAILVGNCGGDPDVKTLKGGSIVATISLATSDSYKNQKGEVVESTQWHRVIVWNKLAEVAEKYVRKGQPLYVEGTIKYRKYEGKDGVERYMTEIWADKFDMLGRKRENNEEDQPQERGTSRREKEPIERDDLPY